MSRFATVFAFLITAILLQSGRVQRFEDLYECYIIVDVEVASYGADEFEQVDCDEFMNAVAHAKRVGIAFKPDVVANLMDDDGVRYRMYISKSRSYVAVGGDTFRMRRSDRRRLVHLLGAI